MIASILFIHQNFPAQYKLLAEALSRREDMKIVALGQRQQFNAPFNHIRYIHYSSQPDLSADLFPPLTFFSEQVRRGDMARLKLMELKQSGFEPDICFVHPGWGEALFLRDVFPRTHIVSYLEHYYRSDSPDLTFDPERAEPRTDLQFISLKNLATTHIAALSDTLVSPTRWQADRFPPSISSRIQVIHEGIDTAHAAPGEAVPLVLANGESIAPGTPLITYVSRSLEPYRGFHMFMRALPRLMESLPSAHVALVGGLHPSYGRNPPNGGTWKDRMLEELAGRLDLSRIHFLSRVPYNELLNLFRLSTVHVYLTYPFVLSWSLLDAMACGCAIVASDTAPVREIVSHDRNGRLVDFFDANRLADTITGLALDPAARARLSGAARQTIVDDYDFRRSSLPRYERLIESLLDA